VVPGKWPKIPGMVRSSTLYDLIPLRFPEHYLADPAFKAWYLAKLEILRDCDHLLAISETSRLDAIELLGLPGDRIQMQGGRLYINDAIVPRRAIGPFANDVGGRGIASTLYVETLPNGREHELVEISDAEQHDDTPSFVVPPKHYFMMGDNRDNSLDSRIAAEDGGVGFVPEDNLVARADLVLLSRDPAVAWFDVAEWPHAFRLARLFGHIN